MKLNMKHALFTNESQATIDGLDIWGKGHLRRQESSMFRQQQRGGA